MKLKNNANFWFQNSEFQMFLILPQMNNGIEDFSLVQM